MRARAAATCFSLAAIAALAFSMSEEVNFSWLVVSTELIGTSMLRARAEGASGGLRGFQVRLSFRSGDLKVFWVNLHERGACLDILVVFYMHRLHVAGDPRTHRIEVNIHLRIVGGLETREVTPQKNATDKNHHHGGDNNPALVRTPARIDGRRRCGGVFHLGIARWGRRAFRTLSCLLVGYFIFLSN